jgi:hypothetical protein
MARVTAHRWIYCAPFTALQNLVPSGQVNSRNNDFDIVAAAQWVMWPIECRHVYVECLKKEITEHYWEPWSKQRWTTWKVTFRSAGDDARHDDRTRNVARQAVQRMEEVEMEVAEEGSARSDSGNE